MRETPQTNVVLKPMPLWQSALFFGIPTAVVALSAYVVTPFLCNRGFSPFMSFSIAMLVPLASLLVASLVAYRMEGNPPNWGAFKARFRLRRMTGRDWLWSIGALVVMLTSYGLVMALTRVVIVRGILPLPGSIPAAIDPRIQHSSESVDALFGGSASGDWSLAAMVFVLLFFNVVGEELWWRGYVLPRQELVHGRNTWLIHGLMWTLFHAFKWWELAALLPFCLVLSYVAQRRKNTWPGIVIHFAVNGLGLAGIVLMVLG